MLGASKEHVFPKCSVSRRVHTIPTQSSSGKPLLVLILGLDNTLSPPCKLITRLIPVDIHQRALIAAGHCRRVFNNPIFVD